mmetsp:Transcript_4785/g.10491  ORF Transcript_4785/g.10491 Transcript_4785/m.10491 type:complete len:169 (-) Transcript_4785:1018-1524(-)
MALGHCRNVLCRVSLGGKWWSRRIGGRHCGRVQRTRRRWQPICHDMHHIVVSHPMHHKHHGGTHGMHHNTHTTQDNTSRTQHTATPRNTRQQRNITTAPTHSQRNYTHRADNTSQRNTTGTITNTQHNTNNTTHLLWKYSQKPILPTTGPCLSRLCFSRTVWDNPTSK